MNQGMFGSLVTTDLSRRLCVGVAEVDNEINNGVGDEDDADLEPLQVEVFDLALRKTINTTQTDNPLVAGRFVTFDIEVFNQGTINAQQIEIIDYIPTGLTLADNNSPCANT